MKKLRVEVSWWGHVKGHGVNEQDAHMQALLICERISTTYNRAPYKESFSNL